MRFAWQRIFPEPLVIERFLGSESRDRIEHQNSIHEIGEIVSVPIVPSVLSY